MTIDPTVTDHEAERDCWIDSSAPTVPACLGSGLRVGVPSSGDLTRALLYFDMGKIPADASVSDVDLKLYVDPSGTVGGVHLHGYDVKTPSDPWTNQATWNSPDGTSSWTGGAGGGPSGTTFASRNLNGSTDGYRDFNDPALTSLVGDWVHGTTTNNGLMIKQDESSTDRNQIRFISSGNPDPTEWPTLTVSFMELSASTTAAGQRNFYTYTTERLTDKIDSRVNDGNGNLLVTATDAHITGVAGLDFVLKRYYNSSAYNFTDPSELGQGWSDSVGGSVRLTFPNPGDQNRVLFYGPSGYMVRFEKNASGGYARMGGLNASLTFDSTNQVYRLEWYDNSQWVFDTSGQLTSMRDKTGNNISFTYNGSGKLTEADDTTGHAVKFHYDGDGMLSSVDIDTVGGTVLMTYTYDYTNTTPELLKSSEVSYVNTSALPDESDTVNVGAQTKYLYDADGRLQYIKDARETSDPNGTAGGTTQYSFDSNGRVASYSRLTDDPDLPDSTTSFDYTVLGSGQDDKCYSDSQQTNEGILRVDVDGPRTDLDDTTTYCADAQGRVVRSVSPTGVIHRTSFNDDSQATSQNLSGSDDGGAFTNGYDDNDNATSSVGPNGETSRWRYGDSNSPHMATSAQTPDLEGTGLQTWDYTYDNDGLLIEADSPELGADEITYHYCWNSDGTLQRVDPPDDQGQSSTDLDTDPDGGCGTGNQGNDTLYDYYDGASPQYNGLLKKVTPPNPDGGKSYTYDALSRIMTETDGRGVTTSYTYDALDHTVGLHYNGSGSGTADVTRTYDPDGNLTDVDDPTGTTTYTYDELNRKTSQSSQAPAGRTTYTYDPAGDLLTVTNGNDPDSTVYTYNAAGQVASVDDQRASTNTITIDYDSHGDRDKITFPMPSGGDLAEEYRYDDAGHVDCVYSYRTDNPPGNGPAACPDPSTDGLYTYYGYDYTRPSKQQATNTRYYLTTLGGKTTRYTYDGIGRMLTATTRASSDPNSDILRQFGYIYDQRSNITKQTVTGTTPGLDTGTFTMAYNGNDEICWYVDSDSSNDCSTTPSGATTFDYTGTGSLASATGGPLGNLNISYNLLDQTSEVNPPNSAPAVPMTYQGTTQDIRTSAGDTTMAYAKSGLSEQQAGSGATATNDWFVRLPDGTLLADISPQSGGSYSLRYYLVDAQQSIMATVDTTGTTIRYLYDPYGTLIRSWIDPNAGTTTDDGSENSNLNPPATDTNPWRFQSGYYDHTTGLLKYGTRYYWPTIARWTQMDPETGKVSDPISFDSYNFTEDDPVDRADQSGRFDWGLLYDVGNAAVDFFTGDIGGAAADLAAGMTGFGAAAVCAVALAETGVGEILCGVLGLAVSIGVEPAFSSYYEWWYENEYSW